MTSSPPVPAIAFLGVTESFLRTCNVHPLLAAYNLRQLRVDVIAPFYPLPVGGLNLVFAVYGPSQLDRWILRFTNEQTELQFTISAELQAFKASEVPPHPGAVNVAPVPTHNPWFLLGVPFPKEYAVVAKPSVFKIDCIQGQAELWAGGVRFLAYDPEPLSAERIAAIRTDPHATKTVQFTLSCKLCNSKLMTFAALDRSVTPPEDAVWYEDLPDEFRCQCAQTVIDLTYLRRGFHALLGERFASEGEEISTTRLYELSSLEVLLEAYERVLADNPSESRLQEFITANPVLLHMLSPRKLVPKAPILSKYQTDYAVLTSGGELVLVELESGLKRLLKRDGHQTAGLTHAIGQVQDWLHEFRTHRLACLSDMRLRDEEVSRVRGLVVMGRAVAEDRENLRRLKASMSGDVGLLTYADLSASLAQLIKELRRDYRPGPAAERPAPASLASHGR